MPDQGVSLLNLGVMNVLAIKHPKAGDIAIHNGAGVKDGKPCLVMFNGSKWIRFTASAELEPSR
jgi:hypothetical protein